jgi:glyoxylase-like metal-dependent hydrolase (beta-lactamase superfamily II)
VQFHSFTFSPFSENTYVIWSEQKQCLIVDPGCYNATEEIMLENFIADMNLKPIALLNTHGHIDHVFGNDFVKNKWNIPMFMHEADLMLLERAKEMAALWNLKFTPSPLPDFGFTHGETLELGDMQFELRHVPGHAPGHFVFVFHDEKTVFCGDTLFQGSIGRTDLPGGNHDLLISSIRTQLFTLPDDYTLLSGHGPATTVGSERMHNPFF